ncbi:GNAT family N-acetyltransferase [Cupriavidus basilensis]|uniref:GNAT family N-acetyltransferase n=1 Tax=Cupriavidus basilensis TaxID=68895 RepID=A0ABT6AIR4_9BURK|nr:GNAT family N-acetyltransferase [Cupriavidus basilensis]MDF3832487.1 GNAT family N-acetyltransferase [Cupriavidus basilensis]
MTRSIELLPAGAQDAALIADLHTRSWQFAYHGQLPADYLEHTAPAERLQTWQARLQQGAEAPLEVILARVDGEPAGFYCLQPEAEPQFGIYLDNLHVLPQWHGLGLGKRLFAHCARRVAGGWPGQPLFLYVLEGNTQAREFYRRLEGIESEPFDDLFPGAKLIVPVRRVRWPDVDALLRRLGGQPEPAAPASR